MLNKDAVLSALGGVKYPGFEKDIVTFGFIKDIDITDNNVYVETEIVSSSKEVGDELKGAIEKAIQAIGATRVDVVVKQPKPPVEKSNSQSGKNLSLIHI